MDVMIDQRICLEVELFFRYTIRIPLERLSDKSDLEKIELRLLKTGRGRFECVIYGELNERKLLPKRRLSESL